MTTAFTFWKSTLTGAVFAYPADMGIPSGLGWEPVHEDTYRNYCHDISIDPLI